VESDDQSIQTILFGLPEEIYAVVDSCETAQEICLRVQQMMKGSDIGIQEKRLSWLMNWKGSDIGIQEKKAKFFNEWERFTSNEGESIESYYHRFLKLMNDLKRNKHFPEKIASNLKFLNNLQPEWSRHKEVGELKAERLAKTQDPLSFMENSNNPYIVRGNGRNQFQQNTGNLAGYNDVTGNQNQIGNGNLVAARAEGNAAGQNGNQIRCYNCRGEEAGIQLQAEEYDLMAAVADLDKIKEVNANCILMANLQQASTSGFNLFFEYTMDIGVAKARKGVVRNVYSDSGELLRSVTADREALLRGLAKRLNKLDQDSDTDIKPSRCDLCKISGHVQDHFRKKVSITPAVVTSNVATPTVEKTNDGFQTVGKKKKKKGKSKFTNGGQFGGHSIKQTVRYKPKTITSTPKKRTTNVGNASKTSTMLKTTVTYTMNDNIHVSNPYSALDEESKEEVENVYDESANLLQSKKPMEAGSDIRRPILNKKNYVLWSSRLLRYAKSRLNGKLIYNSIINGPYVRRMIPELGDQNRKVHVNETFHEQTDDELIKKELK
nr:zinc knuckle CX2CX4HX4C [Tanacetum cinerariifolium]